MITVWFKRFKKDGFRKTGILLIALVLVLSIGWMRAKAAEAGGGVDAIAENGPEAVTEVATEAMAGTGIEEKTQTGTSSGETEEKKAKVKEKKGWHLDVNGKYYYIDKNGKRVKGWLTLNSKTYYLNSKGYRSVSWKLIKGSYYYFNSRGVLRSGWIRVNKKKYYCDPKKGGARTVGWKKIDGYKYYFNSKGVMQTGLIRVGKKNYYLKANGRMATGWQMVNGEKYYFVKRTGERAQGWQRIDGYDYYFNHGKILKDRYTKDGYYVDAEGKRLKASTLKEFLQIALQPVGRTMYVWGGGWDEADKGANMDSRTIGVSPRWENFFNQQTSSYNYRYTRFQIHDGLDCSGFVGWAIYNAFNTKNGNSGYVMLAQDMTRTYAAKGWGSYTAAGAVTDYRAGDIMSTTDGHVYIVLGACPDGSIVIVHASPNGVQINGTCTRAGSYNSEAIQLATRYMSAHYPRWYAKFPSCSRGISYLNRYSRMRWHLTGNCIMSDPDGYADKSAAQILQDLLG